MIHLNSRDPRPIYEQIMDNLRRLIISGGVAPGERLPSVRELAAQLAINPNTIQRGYRELEQQGWIATVPGKGCFVCDRTPEQERQPLMMAFDKAVAALLAAGVTRQELTQRLVEGGQQHASDAECNEDL